MSRHGRLGAATAAAALVLVAPTACASSPSPDRMATDNTDSRSRTVARADVDGDGSRDVVTYRVVRGDRVRIGVQTANAASDHRVLDTGLWPGRGGAWHGAAGLDGTRGVELVVGTTMGAHTPLFTVLTMRSGRLRVQHNPLSGEREWWVDAFLNGYSGWTRTTGGDEVRVVARTVLREGAGRVWTGEAHRFRWGNHRWLPDGQRGLRIRRDRTAARLGGWHVPGLARWPS